MKINKIVSFIVIAVLTAFSVLAQPAALPSIVNSGTLRARAYELATEVNASMWAAEEGDSLLPSDTTYDRREWIGRKTSPEIMDQIKQLKLFGQTVSSSAKINIGASINGKDGSQLFGGMNTVVPVQVGGVWTLPASAGNISYALSSVPFEMGKEVRGVAGVGKNIDGTPGTVWMGYGGTKIYVSPNLHTLVNPVLRVSFADGSVWDYAVSDGGKGKKIVTIPLAVTMSGSFKDTISLKDPPNGFTSVVSIKKAVDGTGVIPTIEVVITSAPTAPATVINFDISTTDGKRPVKLWYRRSTDANDNWASTTLGTGTYTGLPFNNDGTSGTFYVVPEFKAGDLTEPPPGK